jgi:general secretion pathway protein E
MAVPMSRLLTHEFGEQNSTVRQDEERHIVSRFLDHLVSAARVDQLARDRAESAHLQSGERIDTVLLELGIITASDLQQAVAEFFSLPLVRLKGQAIPRLYEDALDAGFLFANKVVPLSEDGDSVTIAIADPWSTDILRAISFAIERPVKPVLAAPQDIEVAIRSAYGAELLEPSDRSQLDRVASSSEEDLQRLKDIASEAPIIRYVGRVITDAVAKRASDIHIEPLVDCLRVRYRLDGVLTDIERLPPDMQAGIATRIKILAKLNIAERRLPQDGRTKFIVEGREVDLRVSTAPVLHGESIVLRVLDQSQAELSFPALGFSPRISGMLHNLLEQPNGIVLVTGPTGSGKTTTLYAGLRSLNSVERKLFTVEDPIEYQLPGINQIQVKPSIDLGFAQSLRAILRQDPDIVMIGEIRDLETARISMQAALTGHLVLSTLHTNSATATITRLLDMGAEDYLLASTLKGVLAQRLVRSLCTHCAQPSTLLASKLKAIFEEQGASHGNLDNVREPVGCSACRNTGYYGRTTIHELLIVDQSISAAIADGRDDQRINRLAQTNGMQSLVRNGLEKVVAGETTLAEVLRAVNR